MKNILILDNDLYFANMMKLYLLKQNIDCTICDNGNQAIDYINQNVFNLIICNTQLGHKTGMELVMLLKKQLLQTVTPIILITQNNNAFMNSYIEEIQPDAILHKPVSFQTLMDTIKKIESQIMVAR